jgi:amidase
MRCERMREYRYPIIGGAKTAPEGKAKLKRRRTGMSRDAALSALDRIDPDLGAFIEVDRDKVLAAAEAPRAGRLFGVLIAIKDLIDTAGLRTTYGSEFYAEPGTYAISRKFAPGFGRWHHACGGKEQDLL